MRTEEQRALRVGVVGLGAMGRPISRHLAAAGHRVFGYDPMEEAAARAAALGVTLCASAAELAASCDLAIILVGFEAEVEDVLFGAHGLAQEAHPHLTVAIGSTIAPGYCRELSERLAALDIALLDIPLARGEQAAEAGRLLLFAGGPREAFERFAMMFSAFASNVHYLGPSGAGQVGKMVNNLILWACVAINDEGLRLGEALGVAQGPLRLALGEASAQNWALSTGAENRPVPWAEKDMHMVLSEAEALGFELPMAATVETVITAYKRRKGLHTPEVPAARQRAGT
jgi:3-hydroxyisobutyrate dehydrogenase-like beta-hydroxyacid dehydrogenase